MSDEEGRRTYDNDRWFEKHVTEGIDALRTTCGDIDKRLTALSDHVRSQDVAVERRLTKVEERTKQRATVISTIGALVASAIAALVSLFTHRGG